MKNNIAYTFVIILVTFSLNKAQLKGTKIVVGQNVQVSHEKMQVAEPWNAVNPKDTNNLIVAAMVRREKPPLINDIVFYFSKDGGKSWHSSIYKGAENGQPERMIGADPTVCFSKSGTAFYFTFGANDTTIMVWPGTNMVHISSDGGKTTTPKLLPYLHFWKSDADLSDGTFGGNVYVYGRDIKDTDKKTGDGFHIDLLRTEDDGITWTTHQVVSAKDIGFPHPFADGCSIDAAPNSGFVTKSGKLILPFGSNYDPRVELGVSNAYRFYWITTSDNGGSSFSKPYRVSMADGSDLIVEGLIASEATFGIDKSNGPFSNQLYVTWLDDTNYKMLFSSSSNEGKTWTKPVVIDSSISSNLAGGYYYPYSVIQPNVTVNNRGVILLTYYKIVAGHWLPDGTRQVKHQRFATASLDGGATFLAAVPVATISTDFFTHLEPLGKLGLYEIVIDKDKQKVVAGDYLTTTAGPDGTFYAVWMDGRTGVLQLWYSPIRVLY